MNERIKDVKQGWKKERKLMKCFKKWEIIIEESNGRRLMREGNGCPGIIFIATRGQETDREG